MSFMALKKGPPKPGKKSEKPISFRLSQNAINALNLISSALNKSKSQVIEELLAIELQDVLKRYPKELQDAKKGIKLS